MKKTILILSVLMGSLLSFGQTATNFNCNDCASVNHDLFTELNAGKVVVICWVMPCSACIAGALSAQSACNSFSTSNPGKVMFYCVDDYANTTCATLSNWCTTNGITNANAKFSNVAIDMANYGAAGMPKVVVLGSTNHTIFYNMSNAAITTSGIQTAITNALGAIAAGVNEVGNSVFTETSIYPNPSNASSKLVFNLAKDSKVKVEILNQLGQKVAEVFNSDLQKGENSMTINTSELSSGNYFINISDGELSKKLKFVVVR